MTAVTGIPARAVRPLSPPRRVLGVVLWGAALANAAVIVELWLDARGLTGPHDTAGRLTSAGRITGLLGAYLALVQVLLLARLPALEHRIGFDRLTVWHRRNGKATLGLVLVHTVLITWGYTLTDGISLRNEISSLWSDYPHMVTATVATGLMLAVVVTSLVIVRRRLPYELWQVAHLTAYASIALGYLHQVPSGTELAADGSAATYWHLLYVTALALLVTFRVLMPLARAVRHDLRVAEVLPEGPGVVSIVLTGHHLDALRAQGGQFFRWRFLTLRRCLVSHPFSLSARPTEHRLRITVKAVGGFTQALADLSPGTRVMASGPFGTFTAAARRRPKVLLIAGGIGVTPVRALLEELPAGSAEVTIVYRAFAEEDFVLRDEIDALARERVARVVYLAGDHRDPAAGRLLEPDHLLELLPDLADHDVFLCGPPAMTDAVEQSLRQTSIPRRQVHVERFAY